MTDFSIFRKFPRHDVIDYTRMLRKLLPVGRPWGFIVPETDDVLFDTNTDYYGVYDDAATGDEIYDTNAVGSDTTSTLGKFFIVIANELARLEVRAYDLVNEGTPGLSIELVDEYRDQYIAADSPENLLIETDEDITQLAHAKEYGEFLPFTAINIENYCEYLGFDVTVNESPYESTPSICGLAICGLSVCAGRGAYSIIEIVINDGDGNLDLLKALINRMKSAHLVIIWDDQRS